MRSWTLATLLLLLCVRGGGAAAEGTVRTVTELGVEVVYQVPASPVPPRGVVFLAHGCSHSATDWWPSGSSCPQCVGLPVERAVVTEALKRGYIAAAQSSVNRKHKCWGEADVARATVVLEWVLSEFRLPPATTPIHLFGASSGGAFVGHLAVKLHHETTSTTQLRIVSAVVQISPISRLSKQSPPPLLFMHMARDEFSSQAISSFVAAANSPRIKEMILRPLKLDPLFFNAHSQHLSAADSATLVAALLEAKFIDKETSYLVQDPRQSLWRAVAAKALPHIVPSVDSLVADASGISELLNLAWAVHEISDENLPAVFHFMELHEKK